MRKVNKIVLLNFISNSFFFYYYAFSVEVNREICDNGQKFSIEPQIISVKKDAKKKQCFKNDSEIDSFLSFVTYWTRVVLLYITGKCTDINNIL